MAVDHIPFPNAFQVLRIPMISGGVCVACGPFSKAESTKASVKKFRCRTANVPAGAQASGCANRFLPELLRRTTRATTVVVDHARGGVFRGL